MNTPSYVRDNIHVSLLAALRPGGRVLASGAAYAIGRVLAYVALARGERAVAQEELRLAADLARDVAGAFAQNVKKLPAYYAALDAGRRTS